jgi:mannosylglycoprotein endo-beta-mannosidase
MKMRCLGLSPLERTMARQWPRVRHLGEGNTNTAYFHLIAMGRRRRNFIPSLIVMGHIVADHEGLEQGLYDHFCGVFGMAVSGRSTVNFVTLGIQQLPLVDLDVPIEANEVRKAIKELPPDKALGPDRYTGTFYKSAWPII